MIVNADDFGLLEAVNEGVIGAHRSGSVTSATMFANRQATASAATLARENPSLGVGLHFDIVEGTPVSPAPAVQSLVYPDGKFLTRKELLRRAFSGRLVQSEVVAELEAQLARLASLGVAVTHIDGHQHVQVIPVVAGAVRAVAERYRLRVRVPKVRWRGVAQFSRLPQRSALALMCWGAARVGLQAATAEFTSVFDYGKAAKPSPTMYGWMVRDTSGQSLEIMVHPAVPSVELRRIHPDIYDVAVEEGAALMDSRSVTEMLGAGAQLASYRE